MTQGTSNVDTKNTALGASGVLNGAGVTTVTLTNLNLFAGAGGSLDERGPWTM